MYPISVGEDVTPEGYKSIYQIEMATISHVKELSKLQDDFTIKLMKTYRCNIDNCVTLNGVIQTNNAVDNIIGNVIAQNKTNPVSGLINLVSGVNTINVSLNNFIEVLLQNTTDETSVISFTGSPKNGSSIKLFIRNAGVGKYGGFDSNIKIDQTIFNVKTSGITFNTGQLLEFIYMKGLSKWVCVNASNFINLS